MCDVLFWLAEYERPLPETPAAFAVIHFRGIDQENLPGKAVSCITDFAHEVECIELFNPGLFRQHELEDTTTGI